MLLSVWSTSLITSAFASLTDPQRALLDFHLHFVQRMKHNPALCSIQRHFSIAETGTKKSLYNDVETYMDDVDEAFGIVKEHFKQLGLTSVSDLSFEEQGRSVDGNIFISRRFDPRTLKAAV